MAFAHNLSASAPETRPFTRTVGFWMAALIAVFQAVNAVRAVTDPADFSAYLGLPMSAGADPGFVLVYAARTAFVAILAAVLLLRRQRIALVWMALVGIVMPLSDAALTLDAGAPAATIGRHLAIAVYLAVTAAALHAASRAKQS